MNLYFRFLWMILVRFFNRKAQNPMSPCVSVFRVNVLDMDLNVHMNNGRYLSVMDLGRIDLMIRAGHFWRLFIKGYYPVTVAESIRFRRSLFILERFEVVTQIDAWDLRDIFMSQKFFRRGELVAEGYVQARFRRRGQKASISTSQLFALVGLPYDGPQLTERSKKLAQVQACLAVKSESHQLLERSLILPPVRLQKEGAAPHHCRL